jgi:Dockerin type I domain
MAHARENMGAFSQVNLPTLSSSLYWNTNALYSSGVIEADLDSGLSQAPLFQGASDAGGGGGGGDSSVTPTLLSVTSRKTHGGAGTFDVNLNLNGTPSATVEPRLGGPTQLVFTFNTAMTAVDGMLDDTKFTLTNATWVSASIDGSNLTLNLNNVPDQSYVTVVLNGLTDMAGNPLAGTNAVVVASLYGNVHQGGTVNGVDIQQIKNNLLAAVTSVNFLSDVNCSGSINAADLQAVKNNLLHSASLAVVSSGSASSAASASPSAPTTLGEALGAPELTWSTGGDTPWAATVAEDGSEAVWSGKIGDLNVSWVETTVTGPGTLSFDWMVSSEAGGDYLTFAIDGVNQSGAISGEAGWQTLTYDIPDGTHRLTWTYSKNGANASGLDAGWIRQVIYY